MNNKPKECVNRNCKEIFFVPIDELHLPLICENCQKKMEIEILKKVNSDG